MHGRRLGVNVYGEIDGFEKDGVLGIVVLHVAWCFLRHVNDGLNHVVDCFENGRIVGRGIVLEQSEELDL